MDEALETKHCAGSPSEIGGSMWRGRSVNGTSGHVRQKTAHWLLADSLFVHFVATSARPCDAFLSPCLVRLWGDGFGRFGTGTV